MGVYTIAGGKGGVGKSTTAATLGVLLREAGHRVALVDADLAMANLADVLDVESDRGIHSVLAGASDVGDVLVEVDEGLHLVPGGQTIEHFEESDPANLRDVVDPLAESYDVVLVDTGAGLTHEALVATGLADGTLLVTTPMDEAVADVAKTAEFVDHADANVLGAVVTRATDHADLGAIADELGVPLLGAIPEDPAVETDPATGGDAGEAYRALAATLLTCFEEGAEAQVEAAAGIPLDAPAPTGPAVETESANGLFSLGD